MANKIIRKTALFMAAVCIGSALVGCDKPINTNSKSEDSSIVETQSSKNDLVEIPSFLGQTIGETKDFLNENNLKYSIVEEYIDSVEKYTVISQEPKAGSMIASGSEVKLVVAMDKKSESQSSKTESKSESKSESKPESKSESSKPKNTTVEVPYIIGMQSTTAQNTLSALDLYYTGNYEYSDSVPAGQIISQSPSAGTVVGEFSRVVFVISNGPKPESQVESTTPESEVSSTAPQPVSEGGGERYVGSYSGFRPVIRIESMGDDVFYVNVLWSSSAYDGVSYEFYATYTPVSDTLEYTDGEAYYYKYNSIGQMVEYSLMDDGYLGYFKLYSHDDLRWSDSGIGIDISDSFKRN